MHAQPFNDEMWMAFAGSSEWDRDHQPLYVKDKLADGREFVLVLDATGCCLLIEGDAEVNQAGGRVMALPFPTQSAALTFARGITASIVDDFIALGFTEQ